MKYGNIITKIYYIYYRLSLNQKMKNWLRLSFTHKYDNPVTLIQVIECELIKEQNILVIIVYIIII